MKSFKSYIQNKIPCFLLSVYKTRKFYKIAAKSGVETEPDLLIARHLVSIHSVFVDIGANIGIYTKALSALSAKVISFEPVPFTFKMLNKIVGHFSLVNVETRQIAISDKPGTAILHIPEQHGVKNYYRASLTGREAQPPAMAVEVQTDTLDNALKGISSVSFVKCDVEGHELACIQGALNILETQKPAWLIEINSDPDNPESEAFELFGIMKLFGYTSWFRSGERLKKREEGDTSINYFFLTTAHVDLLKVKGIALIH